MEDLKHERKVKLDTERPSADLKELVKMLQATVRREGKDFPRIYEQMGGAVVPFSHPGTRTRPALYPRSTAIPQVGQRRISVRWCSQHGR